jgi:hypothetical protein
MPNRTDQILSKGMGAVKAVKATFEGLKGVFRKLAEQHGEVDALLRRVSSDADKRGDLWPKIRLELLSHERGELREVYPVLRQHLETRPFADQHDREAGELEQAIERVNMCEMSSPQWGELFDELCNLVRSHVEEEETLIFPKAQETLGDDVAKELEPKFLAAKKAVMEAV